MMVGTRVRLGVLAGLALTVWAAAAMAQAPPQQRVQELEQRLAATPETGQVAILNELAGLVLRRDARRGKELAERAMHLAETHRDVPGQAGAHKNLGLSLMVLERSGEGLPHMQRAHEMYVSLGDRVGQASTLGYTGIMLSLNGKLWQATEATRQALEIFTSLGDTKGMAAATNNLAVRYTQLGDLEQGLRFGLESLQLEESLGRKIGIANNLNSIGNIYSSLEDQHKARECYQRALPLYQELGENDGAAKVLNNLGNTYEKLEDNEEALRYFARALALAQEMGSQGIEADARNNMGIVYKKRKQLDDALTQYLKVVALKQRLGAVTSLASTYHNIAEVCLLQERHREALAYLDKARRIGEEAKSNETLNGVYRLTAQVYEAMGDWKQAYANQVLYSDTREAMLDTERSRKMAELQERYDAEKRGREIALLSKDNELLKKDGEIRRLALLRTRLLAGLMVAATVLVVGATLLLFRRYLYLLAFWKKRSFVGQYRIEEQLTSGGMGVIYRATSLVEPTRPVALKVIREELAGEETQRQRFINEGKIIDSLEHPGIVKVLDRGEHGGRLYIAMELLEGQTLAALIAEATRARRQLPLGRCLRLLGQLVDAVAAIHAKGVIHRDISPANAIVVGPAESEQVKLLDFGLAKADTMTTLTQAGEILGTLSYLAPERVRLHQLTPASDVFSLGALAYELLTLSRPFAGDEAAEVLRLLLTQDPVAPELLRPELGAELSSLVMAMIAKDPDQRPGDEELRHRIARAALEHA